MVSRDQVQAELLAAYRSRSQDSFQALLLRGVTDPIQPRTEAKKRRFHPLLLTAAVLTVLCLGTVLYFSR
ncbi:MAG TPA: hypothetical protein VK593_05175 [Edaphobacter sp.]|nr:hypothetical protein [Edaphobacter sp.]